MRVGGRGDSGCPGLGWAEAAWMIPRQAETGVPPAFCRSTDRDKMFRGRLRILSDM